MRITAAKQQILINFKIEVYIKCKDPLSHFKNCKHYFYMILLQ